jgi:hypothetical protein
MEEFEHAKWPARDVVSMRTMSVHICTPKVSTAGPISELELHSYTDVSETDEVTLTPCSSQVGSLVPKAAISFTSPSDNSSFRLMKSQEGKERLLVEAVEEFGNTRRPEQDAVGMEMTNTGRRSPEASMAILTSMAGQQSYITVSKMDETALTPCSTRAEPLALLTPVSPTNPNYCLMPHEFTSANDSLPTMKAQEDEEELLVEATKEHKCLDRSLPPEGGLRETGQPNTADVRQLVQEVISGLTMNITPCLNECSLPAKMLEGEEKWPEREAVGKTKDSTCLRLPESAAALPLHMPERIGQPPTYLLPLSPAPENWPHWKPPDHGGGSQRHMSAKLINPTHGEAQPRAAALVELQPHQPEDELIDQVHNLPANTRVLKTCSMNNELVCRAHEPPPQLLAKAVVKAKEEQRWGCLLAIWMAIVCLTCRHLHRLTSRHSVTVDS